MYPQEFIQWLDGFSHSVRTRPTADQWTLITERLKSSLPIPVPSMYSQCVGMPKLQDVA